MLLEYYELREQPFSDHPDPRFLYFGSSHRGALASLLYSIDAKRGFTAIIAEPGMGKTSLVLRMIEASRATARATFLLQADGDPGALVSSLFEGLGIEPGQDAAAMRQAFNRILSQGSEAGGQVITVIDDAQKVTEKVLESVKFLSSFGPSAQKLMHIVLVGELGLAEKLAQAQLVKSGEQASEVVRLARLSENESVEYVGHRLQIAGRQGLPIFSTDALQMIARVSHGIPRNINRLCSRALSIGFAMQTKIIGPEILSEVVGDRAVKIERAAEILPETALSQTPTVTNIPASLPETVLISPAAPPAPVQVSAPPTKTVPAAAPEIAAAAAGADIHAPTAVTKSPSVISDASVKPAVDLAPAEATAPAPATDEPSKPFSTPTPYAPERVLPPVRLSTLERWDRVPPARKRRGRGKQMFVAVCAAIPLIALFALTNHRLRLTGTSAWATSAWNTFEKVEHEITNSGEVTPSNPPPAPENLQPQSAPAVPSATPVPKPQEQDQKSDQADDDNDAQATDDSTPTKQTQIVTPRGMTPPDIAREYLGAASPAAVAQLRAINPQIRGNYEMLPKGTEINLPAGTTVTHSKGTSPSEDGSDSATQQRSVSMVQVDHAETLFQLALEHYGKSNWTVIEDICNANPQIQGPYAVLSVGQWIRLPEPTPSIPDNNSTPISNRQRP